MILEKQCQCEEVWKDIKGFEGMYKISSKGRILSLKRTAIHTNKNKEKSLRIVPEKIRKCFLTYHGYQVIQLNKDTYYKYSVNSIVANHFISNPENKPEINHKNCNKLHNCICNLEWVTHKENTEHAMKNNKKNKGKKYKKRHKL